MCYVTLVAAVTNIFGLSTDAIPVDVLVENHLALAAAYCFTLFTFFIRYIFVRYLVQLVAVRTIVLAIYIYPLTLLCDH